MLQPRLTLTRLSHVASVLQELGLQSQHRTCLSANVCIGPQCLVHLSLHPQRVKFTRTPISGPTSKQSTRTLKPFLFPAQSRGYTWLPRSAAGGARPGAQTRIGVWNSVLN